MFRIVHSFSSYSHIIVSAISKLVSPDLKWEVTHMKGKSKFHQVRSEMLACQTFSCRILCCVSKGGCSWNHGTGALSEEFDELI